MWHDNVCVPFQLVLPTVSLLGYGPQHVKLLRSYAPAGKPEPSGLAERKHTNYKFLTEFDQHSVIYEYNRLAIIT